MTPALAACSLALLLAAAAPPTKPLFDKKPALIEGVAYGPEKVFEGDYTFAFETSNFDPLGPKTKAVWLDGWTGGRGRFHIRFIGRQTTKPGTYGHLGGFDRAVLITDLIDARPLP